MFGAPEEIRTPDPQIRSHIGSVEIATDFCKPLLLGGYMDQRLTPTVANQFEGKSAPLTVLSRLQVVTYVKEVQSFGSADSLAMEAVRGTGPVFYNIRGVKRVIHEKADLDEWATKRLSAQPRTTFTAVTKATETR